MLTVAWGEAVGAVRLGAVVASRPSARGPVLTLYLFVQNTGPDEPVVLQESHPACDYDVEITLGDAAVELSDFGRQVAGRCADGGIYRWARVELAPGEVHEVAYPLSELFAIASPGGYDVRAAQRVGDGETAATAPLLRVEL